jgi:tetratricopeptide (TPR) repeat protein
VSRAIAGLLHQGRAEAAVRLFAEAEGRGIGSEWPTRDRVAATLLHLGRPAEARRVWERAGDPPAASLHLARLAVTDLAALDFATAEQTYRAALELDPGLGEAWCGLALLHTQRGDAAAALAAARQGLKQPHTPAQDALLRGLEALAAPYAAVP